jgi:hypothetical protein
MKEQDDGWTVWIQPLMKGYRMACCDCGLVHELVFRVVKGKVQFAARRHIRATAAKRRGKARA